MARLLLLLLVTVALLAEATVPVVDGRRMVCKDRLKGKQFGCGSTDRCMVSAVLKITGIPFLDFVLLQNGKIGNNTGPIWPGTPIASFSYQLIVIK